MKNLGLNVFSFSTDNQTWQCLVGCAALQQALFFHSSNTCHNRLQNEPNKIQPPLLATTDNQFGFKPLHGTDMCIFLLKQTVSYYVSKDTAVFSAFLDASKAFDRTNHNLLFAKLIKRNVPMCIVRLLLSWYRQQTVQVKWGTNYSSPFTVTNGVRQGGVLSPCLFAAYIDEFSIQLGSARVGCTVGNMIVNNLMFAGDVCSAPVSVGCNVF